MIKWIVRISIRCHSMNIIWMNVRKKWNEIESGLFVFNVWCFKVNFNNIEVAIKFLFPLKNKKKKKLLEHKRLFHFHPFFLFIANIHKIRLRMFQRWSKSINDVTKLLLENISSLIIAKLILKREKFSVIYSNNFIILFKE
jgi:hypothetical protein